MDNEKTIEQAAQAVKKSFEDHGRRIISLDDIAEIAYALKHYMESNIQLAANWTTELIRGGQLIDVRDEGHNIFTTEGMNFMLDEIFNAGGACTGDLYVGLFNANITPAITDTAAVHLSCTDGTYSELTPTTEMDEAARQAYVVAAAATRNVTNTASKAVFTMATSQTIYGGFICTGSVSTSDSGSLICAKAFTSRAVVDNDVLNILVSLTMSSS